VKNSNFAEVFWGDRALCVGEPKPLAVELCLERDGTGRVPNRDRVSRRLSFASKMQNQNSPQTRHRAEICKTENLGFMRGTSERGFLSEASVRHAQAPHSKPK